VIVADIDQPEQDPVGHTGPFDLLRFNFAQTLANIANLAGQQAVVQAYHTTVAPFCSKGAQGFFAGVLAQIPGQPIPFP
jgi:hypothetical protein